jgi:hypothetical protein
MSPRTAFRLALRLIGVFSIVQSIRGVFELSGWMSSLLLQGSFPDVPSYLGALLGLALQIAIAVHLFFGPEWLVNLAYPRGRLCTECGYLLKGLPDAGNCPECGQAYQAPAAEE